jgi:phospholipid/cholesterol/gamma-HCH transport system ATP-binding protein
MSEASPLLALEQVSIDFGPQHVLRDVSWHVNRGETVVVIGQSGCGKTCVLKLLIGLLSPTHGRVRFDGRSWIDLNEREIVKQRLRFGFLFQGAALFDSLTVFENVAFSLKEQKRESAAGIREIVRQRLREVGLPDKVENLKPAELSGGMKKRVGLARALAVDPEVMLYDEPTTGLDPIMTDVINELILQTRKRRPVTSVIVTHEMRTVHKVADRVIMLVPLAGLGPGDAQVVYDGPPGHLETYPDERVRQFALGQAGTEVLDGLNGNGAASFRMTP